jgi:hypothetical protein
MMHPVLSLGALDALTGQNAFLFDRGDRGVRLAAALG